MAGSISSEDGDIGFQIAPMVDVVFVLMLFFMACAGSQVNERELTTSLPSGPKVVDPTLVPPVPIVIDISPEGQVTMNNEVYGIPSDHGLPRLREWLKTTFESFGDNNPVIIRPQADTCHESIVDVLNAAAAAKVKNLTFS